MKRLSDFWVEVVFQSALAWDIVSRWSRRWSLELYGALLAALFLAMIAYGVYGAPVPMARPAKVVPFDPHRPAGVWKMQWEGGEWDLQLTAFGTYVASTPGGSFWVGSWRVEGGMLWVSEAPVHDDGSRGSPWVWGVKWDRSADGKCLPAGSVVRTDGSVRTTISLRRRGK